MDRPDQCLNVTLDSEHGADPDARSITAVLDEIPGVWEDACRGLARAREGETISLDEL